MEQIEASLEIDAAAVPPTFSTLKRIVERYYPDIRLQNVSEATYEPALREDERAAAAGAGTPAGPARRRGMEQLRQEQPPSRPATSVRNHQVALQPDGRMLGRLHGIDRLTGRPKLIEEVNVFLLQDDRLLDRVRVDRYGVFEVPNLQPGAYALVAAGRDGFGAVGFQLVPAGPAANAAASPRSPFSWADYRPRSLPAASGCVGRPERSSFPLRNGSHRRSARCPGRVLGGRRSGASRRRHGGRRTARTHGRARRRRGAAGGAAGGFSGGGALSALSLAGLAGVAGAAGGSNPVLVSPFSPTEMPDVNASLPAQPADTQTEE